MSDPRAIAARMTGFRPVDHRDVVGGGTPGLGLTGVDVAGALAMGGANRAETLMVLAKWVQDKSAQAMLFYEVYDAVVGLASREKWKVPAGKEVLRSLARIAIIETVDPHVCPCCGGRREIWPKGARVAKQCNECLGLGRRGWLDKDRAKMAGIEPPAWSKTWSKRYEKVYRLVSTYDSNGLRALAKGVG